jgi:hypothetical protein
MKKSKLENAEYAKSVGKSTFLKLNWVSWKTLPKSHQKIFVILRLDKGYYPMTAIYCDEILPTNGSLKKSHWRIVKFDECLIPEIYLGSKDEKRLIAWAGFYKVGEVLNDTCLICRRKKCNCLKES